ncbi:flavin-containing monooxygenase [Streptomyces sp. 4.24]|uniref:flavin-containing monooxygenase n=1 Tax=Streptomyces tritrimontium TaxID=3406573 RepID=UPI003BB5EA04
MTRTESTGTTGTPVIQHVRVLIVGSGFSGIALGRALRADRFTEFVILERAPAAGGVWQSNTYPGCRCDVPSHLYSFSFAPNPEWTSTYSPQPEIQAYLDRCLDQFGLRPHLLTGVEVQDARWDEADQLWHIATSAGDWTAQVLVSAVGPLTEPKLPDVPGIDRFRGKVMHSARWDHGHPLAGERVASIGTGASAIQYVPEIADEVRSLHVFQRSAPWITPHDKRAITEAERERFRTRPGLQRAERAKTYLTKELLVLGFAKRPRLMRVIERLARLHLRRQVEDPGLRRALTPDFALGCKRVLPSNAWYPALQKPNVELVPRALSEIREHSVIGADGVEREVDTIIFATGFHVTDIPFADKVRGRDGEPLNAVWAGSPRAYLGVSVPGFPNFFMFLGPNSGLGHSSMVYMVEAQAQHVRKAIRALDVSASTSIEVSRQAHDAYNADLDRKLAKSVWELGGCRTFYRDANGRNATLYPDWTFRFRRQATRWKPEAYLLATRPPATAADTTAAAHGDAS